MEKIEYTHAVLPTEPSDEYPLPVVELLATADDGSCWATKTIDVGDEWVEPIEMSMSQSQSVRAYGYTIDWDKSTWAWEGDYIIVPIYKKEV